MHARPPKMKLDPIDLKIVAALQRDGRMTKLKLKLAETVALSPAVCWERLRRMEAAGVIKGYTAVVDLEPDAARTTVIVEINLKGHQQLDFRRFEDAVGRTGALRIATIAALANSILPHAISRLRSRKPGVEFVVEILTAREVAQRVASFKSELGLLIDAAAVSGILLGGSMRFALWLRPAQRPCLGAKAVPHDR